MNSERELFLYELNGHGYHFKNTDWHNDWERFEDDQLNMAWEMWCASAQRQGYKLVPVDPTKEMLNSGYKVKHEKIIDLGNVYKAMIGEVDE